MASPIQKALKFPAVSPARIFSDAPPSREAATTSLTCADLVEVKILTILGVTAPANVPTEMPEEDEDVVVGLLPELTEAIEAWLGEGVEAAMNRFNHYTRMTIYERRTRGRLIR
jgi:hypothetical protein